MTTSTRIAYGHLSDALAASFTQDTDSIDLEPIAGLPIEIRSFDFASRNWEIHASAGETTDDRDIAQNRWFRYSIVAPKRSAESESERFDRGTLLCHGLNEKTWEKYLPWAVRLAELTRRPVVLFPIAFHMNRAPAAWSAPRTMMPVLAERRRRFPALAGSSFANVALSERVGSVPLRFVTSGLQSFHDTADLVRGISAGRHELFAPGAVVDVFGYSIGALLAEALLMRNPDELFSESRAVIFCGGAVMDRTNPVSKAIMDAEAYRRLETSFRKIAEAGAARLPQELGLSLAHVRDVETLLSMLFMDAFRERRERSLRAIADRVVVMGLAKDAVFPPDGLAESWRAQDGSAILSPHIFDPSCDHRHEVPFDQRSAHPEAVNRLFETVFERAAEHLGSPASAGRIAV
ncbi:MAG: DUF6051 family protein [Spirochaetota bacterium]